MMKNFCFVLVLFFLAAPASGQVVGITESFSGNGPYDGFDHEWRKSTDGVFEDGGYRISNVPEDFGSTSADFFEMDLTGVGSFRTVLEIKEFDLGMAEIFNEESSRVMINHDLAPTLPGFSSFSLSILEWPGNEFKDLSTMRLTVRGIGGFFLNVPALTQPSDVRLEIIFDHEQSSVVGRYDVLDDGLPSYELSSEVPDGFELQHEIEWNFLAERNPQLRADGLVTHLSVQPWSSVPGDHNGNGVLDAGDIDQVADPVEREEWVHDLANTYFGDSNLNGEFDSADLVNVFTAGEYEDGIALNSGWASGDWDGDDDFTSSDIVLAFQDGGYEEGPKPMVANANAVPEPSCAVLMAFGVIGLCRPRKSHNLDRQRSSSKTLTAKLTPCRRAETSVSGDRPEETNGIGTMMLTSAPWSTTPTEMMKNFCFVLVLFFLAAPASGQVVGITESFSGNGPSDGFDHEWRKSTDGVFEDGGYRISNVPEDFGSTSADFLEMDLTGVGSFRTVLEIKEFDLGMAEIFNEESSRVMINHDLAPTLPGFSSFSLSILERPGNEFKDLSTMRLTVRGDDNFFLHVPALTQPSDVRLEIIYDHEQSSVVGRYDVLDDGLPAYELSGQYRVPDGFELQHEIEWNFVAQRNPQLRADGLVTHLSVQPWSSVPGDHNGNGVLDAGDIDQVADPAEREEWVHELANTYFGDSNLNGEFDSADLVNVFTAGEYEDGIALNSGWASGDWDGDGDFTSSDIVLAFQDGGYEEGPKPMVANANVVPEPSCTVLLAIGVIGLCRLRKSTTLTVSDRLPKP